MEVKSSKLVDDVWNALKLEEATKSMLKNSSRTTVDWNSFHIKDAIKPKKKILSARTFNTNLADYSLTEAAHIFLNSEGELEVGCPYECKDKCKISKRTGGEIGANVNESIPGESRPHPDLVTSQYARLKAAYVEKSRLGQQVSSVKLPKCETVSSSSQVDEKPEKYEDTITCEDLLNRSLKVGKSQKIEDGDEDNKDDDDKGLQINSDHSVQAYLSEEATHRVAKNIQKGKMACGSITNVRAGDSGKSVVSGEQPPGEGSSQRNDGVASTGVDKVRFALREATSEISEITPDAIERVGSEDAENQALAKAINRDLNCLTDPGAGIRLDALHRLQSTLFGSSNSKDKSQNTGGFTTARDNKPEEDARRHSLGWAAEELVIKPLLRRVGDSSEKCRIVAILILQQLLQEVPSAVIVLLPYVLPVVAERMPLKMPLISQTDEDYLKEPVVIQSILVETSEEVRLQLVQFMRSVLKQAPRLIQAFASDVASILVAATFDIHPEVLLETFPTLELFGEIMEYRLKPVGKQLVRVCFRSLSHNHCRVRVAALKAIRRLTMCGAHDSIYELTAYRDPNLIPIKSFYEPCAKTQYLALLATDRNAVVREELYKTIACWLRELSERREHECRLLPYLLAGFQDSCPHLQTLAFELMDAVGLQYEEEYEDEVRDTRTYLTEDIDVIPLVCGAPLAHPFQRRPCLGARIMVKNVTAIILHAISNDIECWTSGTKELAANFLYTLMLFSESNITMHLQPLLKLMHRALAESSIVPKVMESAKLLGFFVSPDSYLPLMMPLISGDVSADVSVQTLGHALQLLAATLKGSNPEKVVSHIPEICSTLTDRHIMTSIQQGVNDGVVAVAEQLIRAWDLEACAKEVPAMLWLLLNAAAAADFCSRSPMKAQSAIQALALASGNASEEKIIATYLEVMLDILPHPRKWALRSLDALVYCRLLNTSALVDVEALDKLMKSFQNCIEKSVDDDVKLRLLKEVEGQLTKGPSQWADGKRHIGHLWEGFLIPSLQNGEALITPVLNIIYAVWSKSWPKSLTSKETFQDSEESLLRAVEKVLEIYTLKDPEEKLLVKNVPGDLIENQGEKRYTERMKKLMKTPTDAPTSNPIAINCFGNDVNTTLCSVLFSPLKSLNEVISSISAKQDAVLGPKDILSCIFAFFL